MYRDGIGVERYVVSDTSVKLSRLPGASTCDFAAMTDLTDLYHVSQNVMF